MWYMVKQTHRFVESMSDAPILILTAIRLEAQPLAERLGLTAEPREPGEPECYTGQTPFGPCVLGVSCMGPRNASSAAATLIDRHNPQLVVIAGLAGALSAALQIGDLVIPERIIDSVTGKVYERAASIKKTGRLVTIDRVATRPADKRDLQDRYEAAAADMESAAVARVCETHDIPWLCVRTISDTADQRLPSGIDRLVKPDGSADLGRSIGYALTHPHDIPALIRLGRDTRLATETLADALPGLISQALGSST